MKKWISAIMLICVMVFAVRSYAGFEIEKITADFANRDAVIWLQTGSWVLTNSVVNNDVIETNSFQAIGESTSIEVKDPAFTQIFGGLIQAQAVNMDAITNATMGFTGAGVAGEDSSSQNLGNVAVNQS